MDGDRQGHGLAPSDPTKSLCTSFREWILPQVLRNSVRAINRTDDGIEWLTERQLDDLRDQILRQPNRTLLEANKAIQALFLKAQVDVNEVTGESDPVVQLIDFAHPERNVFHAVNQFRIDTPGCVKSCISPDVVLAVKSLKAAQRRLTGSRARPQPSMSMSSNWLSMAPKSLRNTANR